MGLPKNLKLKNSYEQINNTKIRNFNFNKNINIMILRRLGNKKLIAEKIICHFPPHEIYIEPFFGAGGMFFNKPKV